MEKKNLSQQTMQWLYNTIVAEKRMQPGDKLPNELELSEQQCFPQRGAADAQLFRKLQRIGQLGPRLHPLFRHNGVIQPLHRLLR